MMKIINSNYMYTFLFYYYIIFFLLCQVCKPLPRSSLKKASHERLFSLISSETVTNSYPLEIRYGKRILSASSVCAPSRVKS